MMRAWRRVKRNFLCRLALRFPRWNRLLGASAPLDRRQFICPDEITARHLMVLLPGIGDFMDDYEFHGFIEPVRRRGLPVDLIAVDAHYGYYAHRTVLDRLREDIIAPARTSGYRDIWLVGISMGGLGALLYTREHPEEIAGVVALAPYLGEPHLIREIAHSGGVGPWKAGPMAERDYPRLLWQWLKRYEPPAADLPELYLAYGDRDRFAPAHRLLADMLSPAQVLTTEGGHDWPTWRRLWDRFLDASADTALHRRFS